MSKDYKCVVVLGDIHFPFHDKETVSLSIQYIKEKKPDLGADLALLKTEVIPALMSRINSLEQAVQRDSENIFSFKSSRKEI